MRYIRGGGLIKWIEQAQATGVVVTNRKTSSLTGVQCETVGRHAFDRSHSTNDQIGNTDTSKQPAWERVSQSGRFSQPTLLQSLTKMFSHITNNVICNTWSTNALISSLCNTITEQHVTLSRSSIPKQSHINSDASDP